MIHIGNVILPDGRSVHGKVGATHEWDTNAVEAYRCDLEWLNGAPLTADEYNEDVGGEYLHDFVTDRLLLTEPDGEDWEWIELDSVD